MWSVRPRRKELLAGKLRRDVHAGLWASRLLVGPSVNNAITVAAVKSSAATLTGELAGECMEMMLDSGSAVSLVIKEEADKLQGKLANIPIPQVRLITAAGEPLQITGCVQAPVGISQLNVIHQFLVVDKLVAPVILGLDFLQQHNLVLNFASRPVTINTFTQRVNQKLETIPDDLQPIVEAAQQIKSKMCAIAAIQDPAHDLIDDCSIPDFQNTHCEMPECAPGLKLIIQQYKHLFIMKLGKAEGTYHYIPTSGCPVKVPPRRLPAHYKEEVEKQIQHMLDNHIIEQSSSPWMSPAVFVQKKTG